MANYENEFKRFQSDTKNHTMEVLRDDGLYRHLKFSNNGSSVYRFDLITWPGHLCITGDMGSGTFSRLPDMFEFFRTDWEYGNGINPSYWQEKIVDDGREAAVKFVPEKFKAIITDYFNQMRENLVAELGEEEVQELWEEVTEEVLDHADNGEAEAHAAAHNFRNRHFHLSDWWEHYRSCQDFTVHYLWRCFAIAHGVREYDRYKHDLLTMSEKQNTNAQKIN